MFLLTHLERISCIFSPSKNIKIIRSATYTLFLWRPELYRFSNQRSTGSWNSRHLSQENIPSCQRQNFPHTCTVRSQFLLNQRSWQGYFVITFSCYTLIECFSFQKSNRCFQFFPYKFFSKEELTVTRYVLAFLVSLREKLLFPIMSIACTSDATIVSPVISPVASEARKREIRNQMCFHNFFIYHLQRC